MPKEPENSRLFYTNYQKALKYLASHPGRDFIEREVQEATGISKAGVNQALRSLAADGFVEVEKKGRLSLYHTDLNNPLIRQIKVLTNLSEISVLVASLKETSEKIVLFGSAASGTDSEDSDIDIFVLSNKPESARQLQKKSTIRRKVHMVVQRPLDYVASRKKEKVFYDEISRGIVLYERQQ